MHLLYVADPMCSWCYGFGPELRRLLERHPGTQVDLVMGGLRPYNREPMSPAFREMLREHWEHVAQASGLPLAPQALQIEGFVYDTEPACRAVVTARALDESRALDFLGAVQAAFYRDARDVTQGATLASLAATNGYDVSAFAQAFDSRAMLEQTREDFATSQRLGVGGFPTLGVRHGDELFLVTSGFVTTDVLEERLGEIERRREGAAD